MTPLRRKLLEWLGVLAFYFFCLFVFFRLTFPYDTLKERIVTEFNASQKERRLEIDELSGHFLFGVEAEGVRLTSTAVVPTEGDEKKAPDSLALDRLTLGVSLFSYLFGTVHVDYSAELGGGVIEGSFSQSETEAHLSVHGEDVDISGLTMLSGAVGLPLGGVLTGDVELKLLERKMQKAEGKFELTITELTVGDGKAKIRNAIALPKLSAGDLTLKADVVTGRMDITEFAANGPDFEMNATGKVRLREPFERSAADLEVGFKFKEAYMNKSDLTKSIFGSPDGKVPGLFDMDPQARQAKADDGTYHWRVAGILSHPSFRPGSKTTGAKK